MDWLGRAKVSFTHNSTPLPLKNKDGTSTDLLQVCEKSVPECQLNPFLFNGHMQTMWTVTQQHGPQIHYLRKVFESSLQAYRGSFAVDFVVEPHLVNHDPNLPPRTAYFDENDFLSIGSDDSKPMLIVLHGLSGGSYEIYLRHAIAPLVQNGAGWEVCVVNSRGCASSKITSGVLFNARSTWDVRQFVKWARKTFPNRPLFGLGFSLGANILTNYVGEEGEDCLLKGAVVVGNPFNLDVSNKILQSTFLGKEVYQRTMGTNVKKLVKAHKEELLKWSQLDLERVQNVKYLYEFDREVQTVSWGYATEESYYRDASSSDAVLAVRIPFFAIGAVDDPIAVNEAVPYKEFEHGPFTILCMTSLGGHLSWFEFGGGRWVSKPICNFLNRMAFEIDLSSVKRTVNGHSSGSEVYTQFDPVRRKLAVIKD